MSAPNWYQQQQPEHTRSSSQRTSFEQVNHGTGSTPPQYTGPPPYVVAPYNTGHPHPAGQPHNAGYHHSAGHHQQGGGQAQSTMQPQGFGQQGGYAPRQPFGTQSESRPSNAPQAQWDRQHGHWTTAPQWQNQPEWYASAGPHMRGSPAAPELHKSTEIIQNPFAHSTSNFQAGDVKVDSGAEEEELPLLDELGINPKEIALRMRSVALFRRLGDESLDELDLSGPILILIGLGCCLLFAGKIHLGYVYALSTCGSIALWLLLNVMATNAYSLDLYRTLSIFGYGLLPLFFLSFVNIFYPLTTNIGMGLSLIMVAWSTAAATFFFEEALKLRHARWLVAYPIFLFYAAFVLLTVL